MVPLLIILGMATFLILLQLIRGENLSRLFGYLSLFSVVAAGLYLALYLHGTNIKLLDETLRLDGWTTTIHLFLLAGSALIFLIALSYKTEDKQEYYYLFLFALVGALLASAATDLVLLFVGLELFGIASYIMLAIRKKYTAYEAAWKYVILGGAASATMLYGLSFLYGLTGNTDLFAIQQKVSEVVREGYEPLLWLSFILVMIGLGFKLSLVPMHMWTPDVYQGASLPMIAFLAILSKAVAVVLLFRVVIIAYAAGLQFGYLSYGLLSLLALSMLVGNILALRQSNFKRLLAYSGIAQVGYLLIPLASFGVFLFSSVVYYLIAYMFMMLGVIAIGLFVAHKSGRYDIDMFAGLYRQNPVLACMMTIFILSLAGLPITAGFIGKFYLLLNTLPHYWPLTVIALVSTVISYYYYFNIIRLIYSPGDNREEKAYAPIALKLVLGVAFIFTVGMGLWPDFVLSGLSQVDWASGFMP